VTPPVPEEFRVLWLATVRELVEAGWLEADEGVQHVRLLREPTRAEWEVLTEHQQGVLFGVIAAEYTERLAGAAHRAAMN
jgi:hypothetical protein